MKKLSETVEMMTSADYKERFKAEYYQLMLRYKGLSNMLSKWDRGELNFKPTCPREMYIDQINGMAMYLGALESRAELENIKLDLGESDELN